MELVSSRAIQQAYINLYEQLRKYIWEMSAIQAIVDLELNAFSALPNLEALKGQLAKLQIDASNVLPYDDELKQAFDDFFDVIENGYSVYAKLDQVKEVIENENIKKRKDK